MASSSTTLQRMDGVFDPRVAFPAATDAVLDGLRVNLSQRIDWLDDYLQQVKEADVLRTKSANIQSSSRASPSRSTFTSDATSSNNNKNEQGIWVNILKSPARKRQQDHSVLSTAVPSSAKPIASLSYASSQSRQKNIFAGADVITDLGPVTDSKAKGSSSSGSLSRSPAKTGLKGLANISTYIEGDKENAPLSATSTGSSFSRSTSSNRVNNNNSNDLNESTGTPKRNILAATTTAARSPGIRSPLQSSTSARRQAQSQTGTSSLSASAPASPLRSPGLPQAHLQTGYQSPLTRSQRLTQTSSSAAASPSTTSNAPLSAHKHKQVSPSPTPRPPTRVLRSPVAQNPAPASPRSGKLLSPFSVAKGNSGSKIATPTRIPSDSHGKTTAASTTTTPVRVVDDVFTLPSTKAMEEEEEGEGENSKETDMDDDEAEIENILLGYTKTPATANAKKALKSEAVRNAASSEVVEIPIKEKALPAIPQQQTASTSSKPPSTRISPPRPPKSPARVVSNAISKLNHNDKSKATSPSKGAFGVIANISPSKMVRPIGQQQPGRNINYSPVKRDMSHLASIASMLSPSKPESQIKGNEGDKETEKHSRPASPQLRSQSKVPVPQATSNSNSPARPRSPAPINTISTSKDASASGQTASPHSRPVSPSRISSRIAALAGAARGTTPSSRDASPKTAKGPHPPSPRFGLTRSPRLKQALGMESPSQRPASPSMVSNTAPTASGIPTPTKVKRPMISPIQSPNSQRSLALSSLRKAVPGFETNAFTSPPVSPRLPSTSSFSSTNNTHQSVAAPAQESKIKGVMSEEDAELEEIRSQLAKDEALIDQHARAISSLGKSLPPAPSPQMAKPEVKAAAKPIGLSPPAKSPLRKINSQLALAAKAAGASPGTATAIAEEKTAPTPSKDSDDTVMPQTVVKKLETDTVHSTAHKDSTVELPPPSPLFSTFLSQNKRTSTLSFAGLPGRTLGGAGGREKSLGLGLGLGKSLGATAAKERVAQGEDQESQGSNTATASSGHTRQSFYTAALASQSRKRLSSTLGSVHPPLKADTESQGSKAPRTEFSQTARSSLLASQMQQQSLSQSAQPMSHSARFDLLRSRISNIKGTTGYVPPSTSMRTSFAPSTQPASSAQNVPPSTAKRSEAKPAEKVQSSALEKTVSTHSLFSPPSQVNQKETTTLPTSATSTFAATIASFVPAPAFGTSFASLFGAGSMRATKPDSPAKTGNEASKPVQGSLYPSLPSMTNLHMPLPSFSPPSKMHKPALPSDTDEDLVEELASPLAGEDVVDRARAVAPSSPELPRTKRASSVQSIVSAIEAKEAEAKREKDRQSSLSPRKASGASAFQVTLAVESAQTKTVAPRSTRSTTPTFSPPRQQLLPRLSNERQDARHLSSRPESRLSDLPAVPVLDAGSANLSITGMVDIEDPGLDAIPRASFSDDTETPTTDAVSETEDEEMDQADDEGDESATGTRGPTFVNEVKATAVSTLQQSAPPVQQYKPATTSSANLSKSTFKPTRPGKEAGEIQHVHRAPSRAPSVSSLAPGRASTVSLASSTSFAPSRPGTAMSTHSKKAGNMSVSSAARPEIKSLQNAAAAARKEQAEKERKAAIKEERDQKRAAFLAAKREEQDPQSKQTEKKRKDREDLNSSMAASSQGSTVTKVKTTIKTSKTVTGISKVDDEQAKKRKMDAVEVVVHKAAVPKTTVTRPPGSKAAASLQSSNNGKQPSASSTHTKPLAASATAVGVAKQAQLNASRPTQQASTSKAPLQPAKSGAQQALLSQHQQAILSASTAFTKSQVPPKASTSQPIKPVEPEFEPEPFQLPEIDSEYSDSDEDVQAQKAALRPVWTHSPELRQALAVQATFDPDQLFGAMPALKMEEIFRNPATMARLRHRTSSAHWSGPDAISRYEEKEYAKRMGFKRLQEGPTNQDGSEKGSSSGAR